MTFSREIYNGIFGGTDLSELPISFPACRCPQTHPLLGWDTDDPSGVFCKDLTDRENITRLSDGMVDNLRDNNITSVWTGSDSTPTVNFTFDQVFMVRILRLNVLYMVKENIKHLWLPYYFMGNFCLIYRHRYVYTLLMCFNFRQSLTSLF